MAHQLRHSRMQQAVGMHRGKHAPCANAAGKGRARLLNHQWHRPTLKAAASASFSATGSFDGTASFESKLDELLGMERYILSNGTVDFYAVLQVDDDAPTEEIKKAYRALAKVCHPDFLGDEGHNICILLNEAYQVLSDPKARAKYNEQLESALKDDEDDYTGVPLSKWMPSIKPTMAKNTNPKEQRGVFVDEFACIGCKQCVWEAPATFRIEAEHGRSRVFAQWLDLEQNLQNAIDACPVSCIHWVDKRDLPALEYVMQKRMTERTNVGIMMAGQGAVMDVWSATETFKKERRRRAEAQARASSQRPFSAAQEQARRAAASALRKKSMGVFAKFGDMMDSMMSSINRQVSGTVSDEDLIKVGRRKRQVRWDNSSEATSSVDGDYYMVPPERALVPVALINPTMIGTYDRH